MSLHQASEHPHSQILEKTATPKHYTYIMSTNPYVRDAVAQAHAKVASEEVRRAEQEFMTRWNKMSSDMEDRLAAAGIKIDDEPEPDMTETPLIDYMRRIELHLPAGIPANVQVVENIDRAYTSEADLLNTTAKAVRDYSARFGHDAELPEPFGNSALNQENRIQAMVDDRRAYVKTTLRCELVD